MEIVSIYGSRKSHWFMFGGYPRHSSNLKRRSMAATDVCDDVTSHSRTDFQLTFIPTLHLWVHWAKAYVILSRKRDYSEAKSLFNTSCKKLKVKTQSAVTEAGSKWKQPHWSVLAGSYFSSIQKHTQLTKISMFFVFPESTRQRAYSLVAQAYTSITAEDFAAFVGYSVEEAVKGINVSTGCDKVNVPLKSLYCCRGTHLLCFFPKGVVSQGWQADPATRMVMPKKPGRWHHCDM